ncbi:MAG: hypothetical protein ACRCSK_02400 [Fusobacteriaceae bacterium]
MKKQLKECEFITGRSSKRFGSKGSEKILSAYIFENTGLNLILDGM